MLSIPCYCTGAGPDEAIHLALGAHLGSAHQGGICRVNYLEDGTCTCPLTLTRAGLYGIANGPFRQLLYSCDTSGRVQAFNTTRGYAQTGAVASTTGSGPCDVAFDARNRLYYIQVACPILALLVPRAHGFRLLVALLLYARRPCARREAWSGLSGCSACQGDARVCGGRQGDSSGHL